MSDIFISYAREDRAKAKALAELFQQQDWSVWWDRSIPPGRSFDEVIEEALGAAKCVVVLWSKNSASSDWVKGEAAEGLRRKFWFRCALTPRMFRWNSDGFRRLTSPIGKATPRTLSLADFWRPSLQTQKASCSGHQRRAVSGSLRSRC